MFSTDKQTLNDLNIFGKHGSNSVFALFNRCSTHGGAMVLESWFRQPLADEGAINRRSGIIRFFASGGMVFPLAPSSFDAIENYLANTDERSKLDTGGQSLGSKLSNLIGKDNDTTLIYQGVQSLLQLLKATQAYLQSSDLKAASDYSLEQASIAEILNKPAFKAALSADHPKPSHAEIAAHDVEFRFRNRPAVLQLLQYLYRLDVYLSVAKVAREKGFVFASAVPKHLNRISLQGVYHPLVKNAVGNNLDILESGNVIFLTGANMAGKSTFMKSVTTAVYLAHIGFPVAAKFMEFSVRDGMYTTINLPDDLGMGASHFYAEVLRVKKVAAELGMGKSLFVVFDELFRGTNVKDAYEATIALTAAFAAKQDSMFIISTHIIEAGEVLKARCASISFRFLPTRMEGSTPVYSYQLEEGITDDRHGMVIINNEGIIDLLNNGIKHNLSTNQINE